MASTILPENQVLTMNGVDSSDETKPRHSSGVRSATMMSLVRSRPDPPTATKTSPTMYAEMLRDVAAIT